MMDLVVILFLICSRRQRGYSVGIVSTPSNFSRHNTQFDAIDLGLVIEFDTITADSVGLRCHLLLLRHDHLYTTNLARPNSHD